MTARNSSPPGSAAKPIRLLPSRSRRLIAVCGKCGRKLGGGFGPGGNKSLAKHLRRDMDAKGKRAALKIVETKCMDICPKRAVALIDSDAPGQVMIVPARTSAASVVDLLKRTAGEGRRGAAITER